MPYHHMRTFNNLKIHQTIANAWMKAMWIIGHRVIMVSPPSRTQFTSKSTSRLRSSIKVRRDLNNNRSRSYVLFSYMKKFPISHFLWITLILIYIFDSIHCRCYLYAAHTLIGLLMHHDDYYQADPVKCCCAH